MKKTALLIAFIAMAAAAVAQPFSKHTDITLPDSVREALTEWSDLDNDGLLDLVLMTTSASDKHYLMFLRGDTVGTLKLQNKTWPVATGQRYALLDYNRDNQTDIIVPGSGSAGTVIYLNKGGFEFEATATSLPAFETIKLADLDNDALAEWILSGETNGEFYTHIFQEINGAWKLVHDTLKMKLTSVEVLDVNGNGEHDLFLSGVVRPDSLFTGFLINQGDFYFLPYRAMPWAGTSSLSDVNHDGFMDVTFNGQDENGNMLTKVFRSSMQGYGEQESGIALRDVHTFTADLDSDGGVDVNRLGKNTAGDTLNIIRYNKQEYDTLQHENVRQQRFGDLEHDGDLDLMQVVHQKPLTIRIIENQRTESNAPPARPFNGIALPVFNRLFLYWEKPADDHTPVASLTYDLFLHAGIQLQAGDFDLLNERRLIVSHGNNGTQNFRLLKKLPAGPAQFSVQAVDNALHAGIQLMGECDGKDICATVAQAERISACSAERVTLTSPAHALWFSFASGYLGKGSEMNFQLSENDTVFYYAPQYYSPQTSGCSALKAWTISMNNDTIKTEASGKHACLNSTLRFEAESGWDHVNWKSQLKGDLGTANAISYTFTQPDSIVLTLSNLKGCTLIRKTGIAISKPDVQVQAEDYRILKGQSVRLSASGGARYEWSPATGLDRTDVADPLASPLENITYTVTGYDSLNCQDDATVRVFVETTGFIPNLFTPNADGNNDRLKVYGVSSARDFTFSIYNREGSLVFRTSNITEALQNGWDGTSNGVKQPAGVYFWRVKGTIGTGHDLLLNGKESGAIVLVR